MSKPRSRWIDALFTGTERSRLQKEWRKKQKRKAADQAEAEAHAAAIREYAEFIAGVEARMKLWERDLRKATRG